MADKTIWPKLPCKWTHDDDDGLWNTACGEAHLFEDGGPIENEHRFCPYCGGELVPCRKPDCEVCGGRGWDGEGNECMACDGTGKSDEPQPITGVKEDQRG